METANFTAVTSNMSSSAAGHTPHLAWVSTGLVPAVLLSFCFLLGVTGNIAVIILRPNWQHLSSQSQSLMLNLAVSDLFCLLPLPVWIYAHLYSWTFGLVACKLVTFLIYCCIYSSLQTVTAMSVLRYLLVVQLQQRCFQLVGMKRLLVLLWLVAMILSIPVLVVRQLTTVQQQIYCQDNYSSDAQQLAVLLTETIVGISSLTVVALAYLCLHRKVNQAALFNNPQTTKPITSIIVTFVVLWVPYITTDLLAVAAVSLKNEGLLKFCSYAWKITGAVTFVNSCVNPLLYAFTSHNINTMCQKTKQLFQKLRFPQIPSRSPGITMDTGQ
ncbi:C-C chemokine receptor type 4-like [Parambassis ranga]|uniref:C-C chemokine receptor type 4-like n=1 Tax=Parambassis ranga TaxID=210632 RepID=A0A6P7HT29_9TELE|nr:C-C chemokine receptor type 4-like [Parambassis ranga]